MKILCAVHPPEAIRKILECLGMYYPRVSKSSWYPECWEIKT
jgi:hypothetical protein